MPPQTAKTNAPARVDGVFGPLIWLFPSKSKIAAARRNTQEPFKDFFSGPSESVIDGKAPEHQQTEGHPS
jgi:hypothetical protein